MLPGIYRTLSATTFLVVAAITGQAQRPELVIQTGHTGYVITVAFSPDGKMPASGSLDHTIKLWDVSTGTELSSLKGDVGQVTSVAFSPDGKTLASSTLTTVQLWDVSTGAELRTFRGESYYCWVTSVAFSPDGKTIASNSFDTVKLWDVSTGKELWTLKGHSKAVESLAFSPDGQTLVSGSSGLSDTLKLWNVSTGKELRKLDGLLREWLDFATDRVPQMQQEKIEEQQNQGRQLQQLIKFVEADTGANRSVQRPRVFYRRELETTPLVVARP